MSNRRLLIVGPMMGKNSGRVTTQGERLAELFVRDGYSVISVSKSPNRYLRLLDIAWTLLHRGRDVDIQVLQVFGGPSFVVEDLASLFGRMCGHRVVMILRGGNMPAFMARFPSWSRRMLSRADAIVTPSAYLARTMRQHGYACTVIPNIIELSRYPYRRRAELRSRLLWMRAFHQETYNPAMAIRVFARVKKEIPGATLVMAGQYDPAQHEVERLAANLGVESAVRFAGFLDIPAKLRESEQADIFINTNYIDNMPVSVVEAFAYGLPVVATDVGGIADLITDGENGLLVPVDADQAMADAILCLLRDPVLAAKLSENGRRFAEACTWDAVLPQFEQLFSKLTGAPVPVTTEGPA